jgi:hypothetical protein
LLIIGLSMCILRARDSCLFWQNRGSGSPQKRMAHSQRAGAALPDQTYLLPLSLNLSLGSEIRLHGLRRSVVGKSANTASSMDVGETREQARRGSVRFNSSVLHKPGPGSWETG